MTPVELPSRIGPAAQIQELVALSYGLSPKCMKGQSRIREQAWPRQVAMYLTRNLTHHSLPWIGKAFGNRDHTTVIHAIRQVEKRCKTDPLYSADVEALRNALQEIGWVA